MCPSLWAALAWGRCDLTHDTAMFFPCRCGELAACGCNRGGQLRDRHAAVVRRRLRHPCPASSYRQTARPRVPPLCRPRESRPWIHLVGATRALFGHTARRLENGFQWCESAPHRELHALRNTRCSLWSQKYDTTRQAQQTNAHCARLLWRFRHFLHFLSHSATLKIYFCFPSPITSLLFPFPVR